MKIELYTKGTNIESNESIKENAPIFHNSANRAVTVRDYIAICNRQPNIMLTQVWGGDEELPIKLGHIWFSFVPENKSTTFSFDKSTNTYTLDNKDSYYLKDTELRSTTLSGTNLINKGVFDILDTYKIMTMKLHNRHPIYVDFDYDVRVVKYNLLETHESINENIFKIIKKYFHQTVENFNTTYFHATLVKLIAEELKNISGLQLNVKMNITLSKLNIDNNVIYIHLGLPFEQLQVNKINNINKVDTTTLPHIISNDITVDFSTQNGTLTTQKMIDLEGFTIQTAKVTYPIKKGGRVIGEYLINYDAQRRFILLKFTDSTFLEQVIANPVTIQLKYPADNLYFYKNTIARLSSVKFINENKVI